MGPIANETLACTAAIVAAYVSKHTVAATDLPVLISGVFKSLTRAGPEEPVPVEKSRPVVPIRKSVTDSFLICLEDGKKMKVLTRYLNRRYNLTPEAYRERWGLPRDYPMVAPAYARQRSALAKQVGFGRNPAAQPEPPPPTSIEPKRRVAGRRKAA